MTTSQSQTQVRLSDLIAPSFYDLHRDIAAHRHTHYKLAGGRGSTKSSFISLEIPLGMMQDPQANAIAMRKVGRFLEESVFQQLIWAINALGVADKWKIRYSPLSLTYIPFGNKIIFRGADDPQKIKSVKLANGYFKYIWFEERAEFDGDSEERTILQSLMRGGPKYYVFYSWNPPKSMNNWVNQDILQSRANTIVHHSDYRTVPAEWLGEDFFIEAEGLKETKPKAYEHEYLGIATGTGGQSQRKKWRGSTGFIRGWILVSALTRQHMKKCIMTGRESAFFYLVKCTEPGWGIPDWLARLKSIIRLIRW